MWKHLAGKDIAQKPAPAGADEDSWETEADFVNDVDEKGSRWGAKTVDHSGHQGSLSMDALRHDVVHSDSQLKQQQMENMPKASLGYGGKFGIETDRIDKVAETWEYRAKTEKHASQKDYSQGFGGKYGVQEDRKDKSALGWEHKENLAKHESQKDYAVGFGGKFGVQKDHQDKSAFGWEHKEKLQEHESQKDYSKGFGGKYGVEQGKQDKSAVGWDYKSNLPLHPSQKDHTAGFGGKFGVQNDRKDKSAVGFEYQEKLAKHESQLQHTDIGSNKKPSKLLETEEGSGQTLIKKQQNLTIEIEKGRASDLKSKFEQLTMRNPETEKMKAEESKAHKRAQMIKEAQQPLDQSQKINMKLDLDENKTMNEESENIPRIPKSPLSPGAVSSSKVAHELMGRFVTHPELKQRHSRSSNEDEWAADESHHVIDRKVDNPSDYGQWESQRSSHVDNDQSENGYEKPREYRSSKNADESETSLHMIKEGANENLEHNNNHDANKPEKEDSFLSKNDENLHNNNYNDKIDIDNEVEQSGKKEIMGNVKDHPLAPPAHPMADTKVKAMALYDYQAAAADEISFEPDDIITNIDMIDPGWWRGHCRGLYGLFPANYVELLP